MFARLLKHQLKSTYVTFNILYGVIILLGLLLGISLKNTLLFSILIIMFAFSLIAVVIFYVMSMFQICATSLYGKRGYLTFSIPVSPHQLILSKILTVFLYGFGLVLSFIIAFYLVFFVISPENAFEIFGEFGKFIASVFSNPAVALLSFINYIVSFVSGLMLIFFSFALANSGISNKNRSVIAVLIYIGLSILLSIIKEFNILDFNICINIYNKNQLAILTTDQIISSSEFSSFFSINSFIVDLISGVGLYFGSVYLMTHKLELE